MHPVTEHILFIAHDRRSRVSTSNQGSDVRGSVPGMGNYKIEIEAVGGHGDDRTAKPGEPLNINPRR